MTDHPTAPTPAEPEEDRSLRRARLRREWMKAVEDLIVAEEELDSVTVETTAADLARLKVTVRIAEHAADAAERRFWTGGGA